MRNIWNCMRYVFPKSVFGLSLINHTPCQGTIGCTPSSVPMVFIVFNLGILGDQKTHRYPRAKGAFCPGFPIFRGTLGLGRGTSNYTLTIKIQATAPRIYPINTHVTKGVFRWFFGAPIPGALSPPWLPGMNLEPGSFKALAKSACCNKLPSLTRSLVKNETDDYFKRNIYIYIYIYWYLYVDITYIYIYLIVYVYNIYIYIYFIFLA